MLVEEAVRARVYVDVGRCEGIRVRGLIKAAVVARQTDAEVAVVKSVVGVGAELQRKALGELGVLVDRHVPDVQAGSANSVSSGIGLSSRLGLNEASRRIRSDITNQMRIIDIVSSCVAEERAGVGIGRHNCRCAAGTRITDRIHGASRQTPPIRIDNRAISGAVAIGI